MKYLGPHHQPTQAVKAFRSDFGAEKVNGTFNHQEKLTAINS